VQSSLSENHAANTAHRIVLNLVESLQNNDMSPKYSRLQQAFAIHPAVTAIQLMQYSAKLLEHIQIDEKPEWINPLFENFEGIPPQTTGPEHTISMLEAINDYLATTPAITPEINSTVNMYTNTVSDSLATYRDGLSLMNSQFENDSTFFRNYLIDTYDLYYFTPEKIRKAVTNIPWFAHMILCYWDFFIKIHEDILIARKFNERMVECSALLKQDREISAFPVANSLEISERYLSFSKLYHSQDVILNLLSDLPPRQRTIVRRYMMNVKLMLDSVRIHIELKLSKTI
jgi:hypothetical protein